MSSYCKRCRENPATYCRTCAKELKRKVLGTGWAVIDREGIVESIYNRWDEKKAKGQADYFGYGLIEVNFYPKPITGGRGRSE